MSRTAIATETVPDQTLASSVTIDDVRAAAARIGDMAVRTPALSSRWLSEETGSEVTLKAECLQRVGAFKFRGACNALSLLDSDERRRGVLTYSSGNHAQAVACASGMLGIPAVIVMPANAPRVKLDATRAYIDDSPAGGEVIEYVPEETVREELGGRIAEERGLTIVPPYDHPDVIAGQGTAALELFEQVGDLDRLYVCCGGGGLLSGSAVVARAVSPGCEVIGVEPALADDATRSFETGVLHVVRNPPTIADGARTPHLGRYTFALVRANVDRMQTVGEGEIAAGAVDTMSRMKIVVEPSGALGIAGLRKDAREDPGGVRGRRVGVLVTGGNLDLGAIGGLLELARGEGTGGGVGS